MNSCNLHKPPNITRHCPATSDPSAIISQVTVLQSAVSDIRIAVKKLESSAVKPIDHCFVHIVTRRTPFPTGSIRLYLKRLLYCPVLGADLLRAGI